MGRRNRYPEWFEEIWEKNRHKGGKFATFTQVKKRITEGYESWELMSAIENYVKSKRVKDGYQKDGERFFGSKKYFEDFIDGLPAGDQSHADRVIAALEKED